MNRTPLSLLRLVIYCLAVLGAVPAWSAEPPFQLPVKQELRKIQSAIIYTNKGNLYVELFPEEAPWHVANFKYLADKGYFRNQKFDRYYPDYIIQGGGTSARSLGTLPYALPPEFSSLIHETGTLGMARQPDEINSERNSAFNQFHILLGRAPHMDGQYTIFGKVTNGLTTLMSLRGGDTIKDLKVFVKSDN